MMMRKKNTTSRLRERVTLQQEIQTADGVGGYVRTWQNITDLWAEIMPISGRERLIAMQLQTENSYTVTLRYRAGINAGMRLLYGARKLYIRSVINVRERNEILELLVDEGSAD